MFIQEYLYNSAEQFPEKEAVIQPGRRTKYDEILQAAQGVARWLIDGNIQRGDRVGILMDNPAEYIISYFGILIAGGCVVALNVQTSPRTLEYIFNNCRISRLLIHMKFIKYIREITESVTSLQSIAICGWKEKALPKMKFACDDFAHIINRTAYRPTSIPAVDVRTNNDIAQIIYTSGTTGKPKGVMLRHSNLVANTRSIVSYLKLGPDERHMVVLPFFYSFGNSILLTHFAVGATLIVNQSLLYPKIILDMMLEEKATGFSGVPSTYAILLNHSPIHSYRFPDLRYLAQAGGAMSPKLAQELKNILPHVDVYIMYGQTEASARLSYLVPDALFRKAGSIGQAIPGVTLQVLNKQGQPVKPGETGEIVAQGENIMAGYWEDPERTAQVIREEGLWTGDLAKMDEEGYLYIVSRKSEMIKSGAHRIGPKEIEEVIIEHKSVHEAAVLGVEDEILGEAIKACVVLKQKMSCSRRELLAHCRNNLAAFKVPHIIEFHENLPKTASGKVKKNELKLSAG